MVLCWSDIIIVGPDDDVSRDYLSTRKKGSSYRVPKTMPTVLSGYVTSTLGILRRPIIRTPAGVQIRAMYEDIQLQQSRTPLLQESKFSFSTPPYIIKPRCPPPRRWCRSSLVFRQFCTTSRARGPREAKNQSAMIPDTVSVWIICNGLRSAYQLVCSLEDYRIFRLILKKLGSCQIYECDFNYHSTRWTCYYSIAFSWKWLQHMRMDGR